MRQISVQVPRSYGKRVMEIAEKYRGVNVAEFKAESGDGAVDVVSAHISNDLIDNFLTDLEEIPNLHITLIPRGVIALSPPVEEASEQVTDVETLSSLEVFLGGIQSVGSWKGFLGYAAAAGIISWVGLYTDTIYLLVAAMLIAPFAGPAMNTAIATARGDRKLLFRSFVRYFSALGVTILITAVLSWIIGLRSFTSTMIRVSELSSEAALLPIIAGAAGALNQVQSERNSLVSGTAAGVLVAAALAPPAGVGGIALSLGEWPVFLRSLFQLVLQLAGINLGGVLVFRYFKLTPRGVLFHNGKRETFIVFLGLTLLFLAGLITWQFVSSPDLQRVSIARRAQSDVQKIITAFPGVELVDVNARFPRVERGSGNILFIQAYVVNRREISPSAEEIKSLLERDIQRELQAKYPEVELLVDVNTLDGIPTRSYRQVPGRGVFR